MDHAQTYASFHAGPDYVTDLPDADTLTNDEIATLERVHSSGAYDVGPDGESYTPFRGDWLCAEDVECLLADVHALDAERAAELLDARDYGDSSAYLDTPTGCAYLVSVADLALLGRMLAAAVPDALRRWSDMTAATEIDPHVVAPQFASCTDFPALRAAAGAADDLVTVAAIDLLLPTITAILAG